MSEVEVYCLVRAERGLLRLAGSGKNLAVEWLHEQRKRWTTKVAHQHERSDRFKFCFKLGGRCFKVYRSRLVWLLTNGPIPTDCVVDHKDGNRLNDRSDNLELMKRVDSHQQGGARSVERSYRELCDWFAFMGS